MPIVCKLDLDVPDHTLVCGSEFHEALLSDLRIRHGPPPSNEREMLATMFTGIAIRENLVIGPWEVRASLHLWMELRAHGGSWQFVT